MAFVSGGTAGGGSGGGPGTLLAAAAVIDSTQDARRSATPTMQALSAGDRYLQQATPGGGGGILATNGGSQAATTQLNNFAGNAALIAAAQGQLALSQLLLNPLGAAAHLLNPNALAIYYAQLSALLQPGGLQAAVAAAAGNLPQPQQVAAVTSTAAPAASQQRSAEALLLEQAQAAAQVQAVQHAATRMNNSLVATRSTGAEQRQLGLTASPESVKDHISRLISENEAILEPNPMLLKRRPYHRQTVGAQSSIDLSDSGGSQRGSPGPATITRDASGSRCTLSASLSSPIRPMFDQFPSAANNPPRPGGGSLTSGQPIVRPEAIRCFQCNFCHVKFPNEASLGDHESRCIKKPMCGRASEPIDVVGSPAMRKSPAIGGGIENRHPLKKRLLAAAPKEEPTKIPKLEPNPVPQRTGLDQLIAAAAAASIGIPCRSAVDLAVAQSSLPPALPPPPPPQIAAVAAAEAIASRLTGTDRPYTLMLPISRQDATAAKPSRNRPRHITNETFVCFNRTQPMFVEQKPRLSMYSNWQQKLQDDIITYRQSPVILGRRLVRDFFHYVQLPINPLDAKLNLLYMSTCATRPRIGAKPYWRYTVANKEFGQLRMTHSSYWELGHKLRQQLQQQATAEITPVVSVETSFPLPTLPPPPTQRSPRSPPSSSSSSSLSSTASLAVTESHIIVPRASAPCGTAVKIEPSTHTQQQTRVIERDAQDKSRHFSKPPPVIAKKKACLSTPLSVSNRQSVCMGGFRSNEVDVYVRGRGRGRYVCERCGIRCKKPSMLKKHIKSHTDIRPFKCSQCNFSFKTKGNWTKHLQSKAHRRRVADQRSNNGEGRLPGGGESDSESEDRLEIASPTPSDETNSIDSDDECSSDNEDDQKEVFYNEDIPYRKFGQEHILIERSTHTPPSLWMLGLPSVERWPQADRNRACHSAPPAAHFSPDSSRRNRNSRRARNKQMMQQLQHQQDEQAQAMEVDDEEEEKTVASRTGNQMATSGGPIGNGTITAGKNNELSSHLSSPSTTLNNQTIGAFLAKEDAVCDMCGKVFRKAGDLKLHRHTHFIEQQNARSRGYSCAECKQSFRSKTNLNKHVETSHPERVAQPMENDSDGDESNTSSLNQSKSALSNNPRSFVCTDCNVGFRKHGILAKHLRSKMHVMKLETLGKLPDDALSLITKKENGACLNEVDTSDCERARVSLIQIVTGLREGGNANSGRGNSLECREQLTASPAASGALLQSSFAPTILGQSRKRCESMSVKHLELPQRRRAESVSATIRPNNNNNNNNNEHNKFMSANVWVPPKVEQLDRRPSAPFNLLLDAVAHTENNRCRSEEAASDSTGARSETSTPVQRVNGLTSSAPSPVAVISTATRCHFCDVQFESPAELRVHQHTDHVVMRDGNDFKCPRRSCDKVYPNRNNLRLHIAAHYRGGGRMSPQIDGRDEETTALTAGTEGASALHRKLTGSNSNQHVPSVPNHSPGVPEESATSARLKQLNHSPLSGGSESPLSATPPSRESANCGDVTKEKLAPLNGLTTMSGDRLITNYLMQMQQQQLLQQNNGSPSTDASLMSSTSPPPAIAAARLPCAICGACFQDALLLQQHWLSHVCDRPHVCRQCDAGFTTADALSLHTATHDATQVQSG